MLRRKIRHEQAPRAPAATTGKRLMVYATNMENGPGPKPDRPRHSYERASIKCDSNRVVKGSFYESSMTQYIVCRSCGYRGEISRPVRIAIAARNPLSRAGNRAGGPGSLPNGSYLCPCVYRIAFRRSFVPRVWERRFADRHRYDNGRSRVAVGKFDEPKLLLRYFWENPLRHAGPGANFAFDPIRVCQYCFETCLRAL